MQVSVQLVASSEKSELWVDLQAYIDEMARFDNIERVDGEYQYRWFEHYWRDADRWPYWAVVKGERAGFALVRREESGEMEIAEFFVRPDFRRTGVGQEFARQLLRKHPGAWNISEYRANTAAVSFWHRVIAPYRFAEEAYTGVDSGKPRLMQRLIVS